MSTIISTPIDGVVARAMPPPSGSGGATHRHAAGPEVAAFLALFSLEQPFDVAARIVEARRATKVSDAFIDAAINALRKSPTMFSSHSTPDDLRKRVDRAKELEGLVTTLGHVVRQIGDSALRLRAGLASECVEIFHEAQWSLKNRIEGGALQGDVETMRGSKGSKRPRASLEAKAAIARKREIAARTKADRERVRGAALLAKAEAAKRHAEQAEAKAKAEAAFAEHMANVR